MIEEKDWYRSRTIWGSLIAVAAALGSLIGVEIDADTQTVILEAVLQLVAVLGSIYAVFGRLSATKTIA
ncbi:MAG: hypothetical protein AAF903_14055 [Pseudomonadota bacterium]